MADEGKNVRLVSVEGESYEVPLDVAKMSELVKNMIDDVSTHGFMDSFKIFCNVFPSSSFHGDNAIVTSLMTSESIN